MKEKVSIIVLLPIAKLNLSKDISNPLFRSSALLQQSLLSVFPEFNVPDESRSILFTISLTSFVLTFLSINIISILLIFFDSFYS